MSTMTNFQDFVVYLLSTMRATTLVKNALADLGVDDDDVARSRSRVIAAQFETIAHSMDMYDPVLGNPLSTDALVSNDPNRVRAARYRLPFWDDLDFVVFGTADGLTTGWRFQRPPGAPHLELGNIALWKPWSVVEDELAAAWVGDVRVADEWYPQ